MYACSASRIGESDGNINRKRIRAIRQVSKACEPGGAAPSSLHVPPSTLPCPADVKCPLWRYACMVLSSLLVVGLVLEEHSTHSCTTLTAGSDCCLSMISLGGYHSLTQWSHSMTQMIFPPQELEKVGWRSIGY
jgi:hypothetical protein